MLVAADPIATEPKPAVADKSHLLILDDATPPRRRRGGRRTRWIVGGGLAIGLFFALMVPTMCASRESSNRIKCASNLRQIGAAAMLFARAHDGLLPGSWKELAGGCEVTADVFICPTSPTTDRAVDTAAAIWSASLDDPAANHCSYRYAGQGLMLADLTEHDVIAFEPESNHAGDGVNLLFADGRVEWQSSRADSKPAYDRLLADYAAGVRPLRWKNPVAPQ